MFSQVSLVFLSSYDSQPLKIKVFRMVGWVVGSAEIKANSASNQVDVEVETELGNIMVIIDEQNT